jgi:hypothetical protein
MGVKEIIQLGMQFGISGLLIGYIFWTEWNNRRDRLAREDKLAAERKERLEADKEETESRVKLATSLSALATIIQGRPHV